MDSRDNLLAKARVGLAAAGLDARLPLVVGFSGGADSLCLLSLLVELGWPLTAAHFDHALRPESGRDAERAAELARGLGAAFVTARGDVAAFAQDEKISPEAAARELRYRFLFAAAREAGAQAVCTAHTGDDQAETLLLHLLRGAGLAGLKGMLPRTVFPAWDAQIPLVRPLLELFRMDTRGWCAAHNLEPVEDPSNQDTVYARNRVRHELIPFLERYNPNIRATLARSAEALRGDHAVLNTAVETAFAGLALERGPGWIAMDQARLRGLDEGMLRAVLRRATGQLRPGLEEIGLEDVARAAAFTLAPSASRESDLAAGLRLFAETGRIVIEEPGAAPLPDWLPQLERAVDMALPVAGEARLAGGWILRAKIAAYAGEDMPESENEAWLDADALAAAGGLTVRAARPGERIQPLGMGGKSQKISDLWVNARIPRRARALYPLVCAGDDVIWAPRVRRGEHFRLSAATRVVVILKLIKNPA